MTIMFKPQHLEEGQCIASTSTDRQCRAIISNARLSAATTLLRGTSTHGEGDNQSLEDIIRLLTCHKHLSLLGSQLDGIIKKYKPEFDEYKRTCQPEEVVIFRPSQRNGRTSFTKKLASAIKTNQYDSGYLYIFTCPYVPDHVKVGCAKNSSAARIKEWAKCYPDATEVYSVQLNFPQRIEELVHLQMADKRRDVPCYSKSCKRKYHDEWFLSSVEEMMSIIREYESLSRKHKLYDLDTKQLTSNWTKILAGLRTESAGDINARVLLEAAGALELSEAFASVTISESSSSSTK